MDRILSHPLFSITILVFLWHCTALYTHSPLLPSPEKVGVVLLREIHSGQLLYHLKATLTRLFISFFFAMSCGIFLGIFLGRHPQWDRFFDPWLILFLNVPALVTIILCYVWIGLSEQAALTAVVINKLPHVIVTLREGARNIHHDLLDMAKVYHLGWLKTARHIIWPALFPFTLAAARTGLALIWKIVLIVELLGRSNGMGYQLHLFFQLFNVAAILAYTFSFIIVVQCIEWIALKPLEKYAKRWQS